MTLAPLPTSDELSAYYNGVYSVPREWYEGNTQDQFAIVRELTGFAPGRMLEIGCSYGHMLSAFEKAGWSVEGIELDDRAASHARNNLGLKVQSGTLTSCRERLTPPYDVITMFHVLEHLLDASSVLADIRSLLSTNGRLVIRTPNATSIAARATQGWWEWCSAPEHVHLYSAESIQLVLANAGLRIEHCRTRRGDAHSLLYELLRGGSRRLLGRKNDESLVTERGTQTRRSRRRLHRLNESAKPVIEAVGSTLERALGFLSGSGGSELMISATVR